MSSDVVFLKLVEENLASLTGPLAVPIQPRLLNYARIADYLSSTVCFAKRLVRTKQVPSMIVGVWRVVDVKDLDAWIEKEKKSIAERGVDMAA